MKTIKKVFIAMIILLIILIALLKIIFTNLRNNINEEKSKIEENLGKEVILKGDTLQIHDYSIFNQVYILEDGKEISFALFDKLETVE